MKKLTIIFLVLAILLTGGYYAGGNYIYNMLTATHAKCESDYMDGRRDNLPTNFIGEYDEPESRVDVSHLQMGGYEDVSFPARKDNVQISGWFVPADQASDKVVIIVHGIDMCKRNSNVLMVSGMLSNAGFDILLIDMRNHGDSEVIDKRAAAGTEEYKDVLGAYDWLIEQGYESRNIGLMGISMGAATGINAFGYEPGIAAIWADSSFTDIPTVLEDQLALNGFPQFMKNAVLQVAEADGYNLELITPIKAIENHDNRPIMITHGTADDWISVAAAEALYEAAGDNAKLWIYEDALHVESLFLATDEYEQRIAAFFVNSLGR